MMCLFVVVRHSSFIPQLDDVEMIQQNDSVVTVAAPLREFMVVIFTKTLSVLGTWRGVCFLIFSPRLL